MNEYDIFGWMDHGQRRMRTECKNEKKEGMKVKWQGLGGMGWYRTRETRDVLYRPSVRPVSEADDCPFQSIINV